MTKKDKPYRRLPGVTYKSFGKHTLWQGKDHLLAMYSNGMAEDYRRFYYRDIQGLVVTKTPKAAVIATVVLLLCLASALLSWRFFLDLAPWSVFFGIVSGVFLVYLLATLFKGPSCECRIITAVQNESLRAVTLLRHGSKLAKALKPLILEAQNDMEPVEPEKTLKTMKGDSRRSGFRPVSLPETVPGEDEKQVGLCRVFLSGLGVSLILYAIMLGLGLDQRTLILASLAFLFLFTSGLGAAGVLAVTPKDRKGPRRIAWTGLLFVTLAFFQSYGEMMVLYFVDASMESGLNQGLMFTLYCNLRPLDYPLVTGADVSKAVLSALFGVLSLLAGLRVRV